MSGFHVVTKNEASIQVESPDGHRYSFPIVETEDGRRALSEGGNVWESQRADRSSVQSAEKARRFAEQEARKDNLID
jgi:hypothetical protein